MPKLDEFDLDLKVKKGSKKGVKPAVASNSACTPGCITGALRCKFNSGITPWKSHCC